MKLKYESQMFVSELRQFLAAELRYIGVENLDLSFIGLIQGTQ